MTSVVVDASVAIKWFIPEVHSDEAVRLLDPGIALCAPDLIVSEFGNTLWKKTRRGEVAPETASLILAAFERVGIEIVSSRDLIPAALMLATSLDCTVYDSLYLTTAIARRWVLVTADRKFHFAVKAAGLAQYVQWIEDDL